ncbi:hypothetical protein DICPUDRAFT_97424 [Dictyostelium purpureum]|uniref:SNF2-related domain-containing protein n=1 Tax=Dictyostelium purpureum TaxID=5786 RepID=F0ZGL4_DICPU|nr:uncharacterized protein DICPUDRAFT_97424 [Dictyostelium purpureum]EGC36924.1 hypothetical protein DICPUDRAFT_97424 [Dictyostelium purpureum]|eukprot:XP_003286567.1 hypothetical protein DICPUDRAFT_97424 [Dictyostelium purpureum]
MAPNVPEVTMENTNTDINTNTNTTINSNMLDDLNLNIELFRAQVESYKYISRNLPIPPYLLQKMGPILERAPVQSFTEELANLKYYPRGLIKYDTTNNVPITTNTMEYQHLSNLRLAQKHEKDQLKLFQIQQQQEEEEEKLKQAQQLNKSNNNNSNKITEIEDNEEEVINKPMLPTGVYSSLIPPVESIKGLPEAIQAINERDIKIQAKVLIRIDELKEIPIHCLPPEARIRSQIEAKQLRLLELQRKLRHDIASEMEDQVLIRSLRFNEDDNLFVRPIPRVISSPSEIIFDTDVSTQIPESVIATNKKKFFEALFTHARDFKDFHSKKKISRKLINALQGFMKEKERKEAERLAKERIRLLKARDTEGYRDLLAKTKNERLEMLLGETDSLLQSIHSLMEKEQIEKREREAERERMEIEKANSDDIADANNSNNGEPSQPIASITSPIISTTTILSKKSSHLVIEQPDLMTGGKLKEYQVTGLEWLVSLYNRNLNGILADEMGLGKTVQTIAFISFLYERMNVREPFLVVAPLSTISNWSSEFIRWSPKLHVIVYKGKQEERKEVFRQIPKNGFVVIITSFEYIIKDKNRLGKLDWVYIIIDEGHRIKNKNSKLSLQLRQYKSKHRLLLTGTPLQNDLSELWALLNFLLPSIFNSADTFEHWFNAPFQNQSKSKSLINVNEEEQLIIINRLHQVLRFFLLRRLKSDVESQLPDKKEKVIKCNLSALQIAMYRSLVEYGVLPVDPDSKEGRAGRLKMKGFNNIVKQLQKICNHPYLFKEEWDINEDLIRSSGKFDTMDQILTKMHASKHRVLIFTQMTEVINLMEEYFSLKEWTYLRLDGSTKPEERAHLVVEWNRPDSPFWIFVLSTHAGGLGMNLQTADTVIIFDSDWNPQMDLQAQDRCHRIGQTNAVNVYRLISANSIEEKILERATDKLEIDAKIIQAGMFNTHSNDQERRAKLEQFLHGFPSNTADEVPVDLKEINTLIARDDDEFIQFQEMDKEKAKRDLAESKKNKKPIKPRLMIEKELPEWVLQTPVIEKDEDLIGKRRQTAVASVNNFVHDDLTDNQYARMIEKGMTLEQYKAHLDSKKKKKKGLSTSTPKSKRGRKKKAGSDDEEEEEEDDDDDLISSDEEGEEETIQAPKRVFASRRLTPQQRKLQREDQDQEQDQDQETDKKYSDDENEDVLIDGDNNNINENKNDNQTISHNNESNNIIVSEDPNANGESTEKRKRGRPRLSSTGSNSSNNSNNSDNNDTNTNTPAKRKFEEIKKPNTSPKPSKKSK